MSRFPATLLVLAILPASLRADDSAGRELFEKRIRPVLVKHCYECHSSAAKDPKGGLRLDTRAGLRDGGDTGPVITPGKPDESPLLNALRHESVKMPPDRKLPESVIADFAKWVELGAPDPRDEKGDADKAGELAWEAQYQERIQWWSLQPVREPPLPPVKDTARCAQSIDRFILAGLEAKGLRPSARADRRTLVRRLSFALTGLPPAAELLESSRAETSPEDWANVVERLLASPHFGERWARHWMDVVRYSDTYGYEWDIPAKGAWRYRDYLVRAFNADLPWDKLVREQIAGDLLPSPRINALGQFNESLIGPMFYQLGEKRHGDSSEFNGIHQEMLDNKVDALSKAFQAVTVACARCHDHKLDSVSQKDYYALAGTFMSSRWVTRTIDLPERHVARMRELQDLKARLRPALASRWAAELDSLPGILTLVAASPDLKAADAALAGKVTEERLTALKKTLFPAAETPAALESPATPWVRMARAVREQKPLAAAWQALVQEYADASRTRAANNARDFHLVADFSKGLPEGWTADGVGLRDVSPCGDFTVALNGSAAIGRVLPGGLFTHAVSNRMNGALRTPLLSTFDKPFLSFELTGGDFAAARSVYDNAFLTEKQTYLAQPGLGWHLISTVPQHRDKRLFIELATKTSNPNFPPRVGLGGPCSDVQAAEPQSWFGVSRVYAHAVAASPADELARFAPLFAGDAPADLPAAAARFAAWLKASVDRWGESKATREDVELVNWIVEQGLITNRLDAVGRGSPDPARGPTDGALEPLVSRYRELERSLPEPQTVNGMLDVDAPCDYRLNIRGDYDQLGDAVPRGYLRMLAGDKQNLAAGASGRRELAEWIASPANPLTARVFVNRVWHWLFGAGLVRTLDDFGHLGERPSNPELLDHLAARFVAEGWSVKQLIRSIVLSETWCQSNAVDPRARQVDPDNRLLHHFPLQRLDAESIRDAMLAASGRLDERLGGPPLDPFRSNEDPQKRLYAGPVDGLGRRSIYIKMTIMEPPKFLAVFNQPSPKIPTGRRDVTNTPAQSLALLNDPLVGALAGHWAARVVASPHTTAAERLTEMFDDALSRPPTVDELTRWTKAVDELAALHNVPSGQTLKSVPLWKDVAHALFNLKEFIDVK